MRQLVLVILEFALIIAIVAGLYYFNLSKKFGTPYKYQKPLIATRLDLEDEQLKKEIVFFLSKELGLYQGNFEVLDAVFLYTDKVSGADYILITFSGPDGKIYQVSVSRKFLPYAKWEIGSQGITVIQPVKPLASPGVEIPKWMRDLGVTPEQLAKYYAAHPGAFIRGEEAFRDQKTGEYNLPQDWHQTLFAVEIKKDKSTQLVPESGDKPQSPGFSSYWKSDYPVQYVGPGYRQYLYDKVKGRQ